MEWKLAVFELPKDDREVWAIIAPSETDLPTHIIARCMFKLDDTDQPTSERVWVVGSCSCCYAHRDIKINRWMPIISAKETKNYIGQKTIYEKNEELKQKLKAAQMDIT